MSVKSVTESAFDNVFCSQKANSPSCVSLTVLDFVEKYSNIFYFEMHVPNKDITGKNTMNKSPSFCRSRMIFSFQFLQL